MRKFLSSMLPDVLILAGSGSISYGAWTVYEPAGFVVGGAIVLAVGVLAARRVVI